ncbi:MAG: HAD family phosphatase [Butyrivibrio sp.]|nr:HAD family phosphatase [Butyrivibrio sp.]
MTARDFDAVVFDMDGVIFDSERAILECWTELGEKYNISNVNENFYKCIGVTVARTKEIMLEAYGEDFPYDEYDKEANEIFHDKYSGGRLPMKEGIKEILSFLKDSGKKIALASSTRKAKVEEQLRDANILEYFDVLICGDMVKRSKPDPDIYLKACEELGVEPERAYAIEDSFNGIRSANAGKLRPIMVPDIVPADDEMEEKAEKILDSLIDVKDYLATAM